VWLTYTISLSVLGTPVKVGSLVVFVFVGLISVRVWGGGPQSGSRWSARSAARTNDLEAGEDPPHTDRPWGTRQRRCGSSHLLPPWTECVRETSLRVPAPSLIWVHGRGSGDMMMDGVPGVRAAKGVRPLSLSGKSTQQRGGDRRPAGAGRGHQLKCGQGTRTTHLSGHPLFFGDRHRQGGIAELTQRVITAA